MGAQPCKVSGFEFQWVRSHVKCQGLSFSGCAAVCVSGFEFQ